MATAASTAPADAAAPAVAEGAGGLPASLQVLEFAKARAAEIGAVESLLQAESRGRVDDDASLLPVSEPTAAWAQQA